MFVPRLDWEDVIVQSHSYTYKLVTIYKKWNIKQTTMITRSAEHMYKCVQEV